MNLGLTQKVALITGGTHGIGEAIALRLAAEGCRIATFSRSESRVEAMRLKLAAQGCDSICLVADVLDADSYDSVRNAIIRKFGGADIVVNNIGGGGRWGNEEFIETDDSVWEDVYKKNFSSCMKYTRMFLPHMISKKWGRVLTITSIYGKQAGGRPWFNVAKTAQTAFMKNLAINKRYASANITFNSVAPGAIWIPDTGWDEMKREHPILFEQYVDTHCPRGQLGTPNEVADLVAFLCSVNASLINGASISADGGESFYF